MKTTPLLLATAAIELSTGVTLLLAPSFLAELLLGETLGSTASMLVGRIAGAALIAIGLICLHDGTSNRTGSSAGLLGGLLVYNGTVSLLLAHGAVFAGLHGVLLWPVVLLHTAFLLWCVVPLRDSSSQGNPTNPTS